MSEIRLADMKRADLEEVTAIESCSCETPWSRALFLAEIENRDAIPRVARNDERIAGYLCARRIMDEGHVLNLAVHPDYRRRGIGTSLVADSIAHLRDEGCRSVFLEVRASNSGAKSMYEKFGFLTIAVRRDYYTAPVEDAIVMMKRLE